MSAAKLELTVGTISFSGEGEQEWLTEQLDKMLEAVPALSTAQNSHPAGVEGPSTDDAESSQFVATLAGYIREKKAESNQVQRFLATADWLRRRGQPLTSSAVAKALSDNQQKRLANAPDCLNKNVAKGYCEKKQDGFFITPDGLKHLG